MRDRIWFMVLVLGAIATTSGLALSAVHDVTAPVIEQYTLEQKIAPSLEDFFGPIGIDNDYIADRVELELGKDAMGRVQRVQVFKGRVDGEIRALALQTSASGYGGELEVLTAFDVEEDEILGVKVLEQKETAGLGARVADDTEAFIQQWSGMPYEGGVALRAAGGQVDAISGATITSRAFTRAVDKAITLLEERNAEIMGE